MMFVGVYLVTSVESLLRVIAIVKFVDDHDCDSVCISRKLHYITSDFESLFFA